MHATPCFALLALLLLAPAVRAQTDGAAPAPDGAAAAAPNAPAPAPAAAPAAAAKAAEESPFGPFGDPSHAVELVRLAMELRARIPAEELRRGLTAAAAASVPASTMADVLNATQQGIHSSGPIEGWGAFVESRIQAGDHGETLIATVRQEHEARGVGKGKSLAAPPADEAPAGGSAPSLPTPGATP